RPVGQRRKSLSCYRLIPTPCVTTSSAIAPKAWR
ncbi:MAG: Mobile element protein, partial [Olavius algarvensis Gamma 1 endosymbiont]